MSKQKRLKTIVKLLAIIADENAPDGEKSNAAQKIEEIQARYHISEDDIRFACEPKSTYEFKLDPKLPKSLFFSVLSFVTDERDFPVYKRKRSRTTVIVGGLTEYQYQRIARIYDYHSDKLKKFLNDVAIAYTVKNGLYSSKRSDENEDESPEDKEYMKKLGEISLLAPFWGSGDNQIK